MEGQTQDEMLGLGATTWVNKEAPKPTGAPTGPRHPGSSDLGRQRRWCLVPGGRTRARRGKGWKARGPEAQRGTTAPAVSARLPSGCPTSERPTATERRV